MASALIGGVYGVIAVVYDLGMLGTVLSSIFVGLIMCIALSGFVRFGLLAREMVVFLIANLIIGGGMTAIYSAFNSFGAAQKLLIYGELESVEEQMPLALFAVGSMVVTVILCLFGRSFDKRKRSSTVRMRVEHAGKCIECNAIEDSGNLLTEPLSGLPVVVLRRSVARELLTAEMLSLICEMKLVGEKAEFSHVRFITCNTVSGKKMLGAFKPDRIKVNGVDASAWVAVAWEGAELGECGAIVPREIVN